MDSNISSEPNQWMQSVSNEAQSINHFRALLSPSSPRLLKAKFPTAKKPTVAQHVLYTHQLYAAKIFIDHPSITASQNGIPMTLNQEILLHYVMLLKKKPWGTRQNPAKPQSTKYCKAGQKCPKTIFCNQPSEEEHTKFLS